MAGGQGTRLGHNGPKGTYDFGLQNHKSIFEVLCDNLKQAQKKFGVYVQWYIMTSEQNVLKAKSKVLLLIKWELEKYLPHTELS